MAWLGPTPEGEAVMPQSPRGQPGSWSLSLARPSESNQREGRPGEPSPDGDSLRYSTSRAAVELALEMNKHAERARAQTVLAEFPGPPVLLGGSQGVCKRAA